MTDNKDLRICWCGRNAGKNTDFSIEMTGSNMGCTKAEDFSVDAGILYVAGPDLVQPGNSKFVVNRG